MSTFKAAIIHKQWQPIARLLRNDDSLQSDFSKIYWRQSGKSRAIFPSFPILLWYVLFWQCCGRSGRGNDFCRVYSLNFCRDWRTCRNMRGWEKWDWRSNGRIAVGFGMSQVNVPPAASNRNDTMADNIPNLAPTLNNGNRGRNNNNNPNPLFNMRDRLFHALFIKTALIYARTFPRPVRRFIEFLVLIKVIVVPS